jgi:hypothetical protein
MKPPTSVKLFSALVLLFAPATFLFSEELPLGNAELFVYQVPEGSMHKLTKPPIPQLPATARISSVSRLLLMTPIRYDKAKLRNRADLDRLLPGATRKPLAESVEQKLGIRRLKKHESAYASFTDASLVGKKVTSGHWKCVTTGFIRGKNHLINFTQTFHINRGIS